MTDEERAEEYERRTGYAWRSDKKPDPRVSDAEIERIRSGEPVFAIKAYRERTGADLATAKAAINAEAARLGLPGWKT